MMIPSGFLSIMVDRRDEDLWTTSKAVIEMRDMIERARPHALSCLPYLSSMFASASVST